jgi:integrase
MLLSTLRQTEKRGARETAHTLRQTIPSAKMKRTVYGKVNGRPHLVPLPPQAVELLRELHPLNGHSPFVFPSPISAQRP